MQSQLQVKKPKSMASMGPPVSNSQSLMPNLKKPRSSAPILAPVIDLKTKKPLEETSSPKSSYNKSERTPISKSISSSQIGIQSFNEPNFVVVNEYDPLWPNDYQKVIQEMRGNESKDGDENSDSKKRRYTEEGRAKARERYNRDDRDRDRSSSSTSAASEPSGFGRRPRGQDDYSDDSDDEDRRRKSARRSTGCKRFCQGVARLPQRRSRPL